MGKQKIVIDENLAIRMMKFFLETSAPRILQEGEGAKKQVMKSDN